MDVANRRIVVREEEINAFRSLGSRTRGETNGLSLYHSVIKLSGANVSDVLLYHMCFLAEASAQTCRHPSLCAASFTIMPH